MVFLFLDVEDIVLLCIRFYQCCLKQLNLPTQWTAQSAVCGPAPQALRAVAMVT